VKEKDEDKCKIHPCFQPMTLCFTLSPMPYALHLKGQPWVLWRPNTGFMEKADWIKDTFFREEPLDNYIKAGKRIVGYDNAEGKGNHRHYKDREEPYSFRGVDVLINDFYRDVGKIRRGEI